MAVVMLLRAVWIACILPIAAALIPSSKFNDYRRFVAKLWTLPQEFYTAAPLSLCNMYSIEVLKNALNLIAECVVKWKDGMPVIEFVLWGHVIPLLQLKWYARVGAALFFWGWIHQRLCHSILLKRGNLIYFSPSLMEGMYAGLVIASGFSDVTLWLVFGFVVVNLTLAAGETHRWYIDKDSSMVYTNLTAVDRVQAPPLKVAVIGAGAAGLTVGRALKLEGMDVVIYEKSNKLGGTWLYDARVESDPLSLDPNREIVHSSLYHSLRTNLPRQLMGFSDYPFPTEETRDPRSFPGHEEVLEFLNEFAANFGLVELIRFQTEVIRVERVDLRNDRWVVESRNNESSSNEFFDAVVVCNGHHTLPNVADFPGREKWPGKQIHSHNYRVAEPYKDQIVVVIGDGPSAKDISLEIANVAKEIHLSSRSPTFQESKFDDRENMWRHLKIDHANENGEVVFQDGFVVHPDIILHCTGYKYWFPFLKTDGIVMVEDGRVGPLYKHVFPPKLGSNLSFIGLTYWTIVMQVIDFQAKWVAHVLSGKARLPSAEEMEDEVQRHYRSMEEKEIPKHQTHCLQFKLEYLDWLANEAGVEGVDEKSRSLFDRLLLEIPQWRGQIEA